MSKQNQPQKDPLLIVDDPYIFEACQVDVHLVLFPVADGDTTRKAALSTSSHGDAPVFTFHDDAEVLLENLTAEVRGLLAQFQAELPERHLSRLRRTAETRSRKKKKKAVTPTPAAKTDAKPQPKTSPKKQLSLLGDD